jgi:hypothetical protein
MPYFESPYVGGHSDQAPTAHAGQLDNIVTA